MLKGIKTPFTPFTPGAIALQPRSKSTIGSVAGGGQLNFKKNAVYFDKEAIMNERAKRMKPIIEDDIDKDILG